MSVRVKQVTPGSPAHRAGVLAGDVITSISGMEVNDYLDVELALASNSMAELHIQRASITHSLPLDRLSPQGEFLPAGIELNFNPRSCPNS